MLKGDESHSGKVIYKNNALKENELINEFSCCLHKRSDEMSGKQRQSAYSAKYFFMNGLKLVSPISSGKILFLFLINNFLALKHVICLFPVKPSPLPPHPAPPPPRDCHMNGTNMLVVSFRGENNGFRFSNRHLVLVLRTDSQCFFVHLK